MAKEVLVVKEQLFKARAGNIQETQLGLRGCGGCAATLGDVLAAGAGGLHHLIHGARTGIKKFFAEPDRGIVDDRRSLKTGGVAVAATGSEFLHAANWFRLTESLMHSGMSVQYFFGTALKSFVEKMGFVARSENSLDSMMWRIVSLVAFRVHQRNLLTHSLHKLDFF